MIVFQELSSINPFELGCLEKMTGFPDKYKIRLGDYRIGITMVNQTYQRHLDTLIATMVEKRIVMVVAGACLETKDICKRNR